MSTRAWVPWLFLAACGSPRPAVPGSPDPAEGLIERLGDESPAVREDAERELLRLGTVALPALRRARKSSDPEIADRALRTLLRLDPSEPLPPFLEEVIAHWLQERRPPDSWPGVSVVDAFEQAPWQTVDYLVRNLARRETSFGHSQSTVGMEASRWLGLITDRPLPGVVHLVIGQEENTRKTLEGYASWWNAHKDRPVSDWFGGLEWAEVKRIRLMLYRDPGAWPPADARWIEGLGERPLPYLLNMLHKGRQAYRASDKPHYVWENACHLLRTLTGQEIAPRDNTTEAQQEVIRLWGEWSSRARRGR